MEKDVKLKTQIRDCKKEKNILLRKNGFIPACVYGSEFKNLEVKLKLSDFEKIFDLVGEFALIDLEVDKHSPIKVIVKDIQRDVVSGKVIHVDFYKVDMNKKVTTEIPLMFIGEAKAVKELGGVLIKNLDSLEIECFPSDLVEYIEVDLSSLNTFDDHVQVKNLNLPSGLKALEDENVVIVSVSAPRIEKETKKEEPQSETKEKEEEKTENNKEKK